MAEYRPYWQQMRDYIHGEMGEELSQEDIDTKIANALSIYSYFTFNQDDIGEEFKARIRTFIDPVDLIQYLEEGGVPPECVEIWAEEDGDDYEYHVYISDTTP